MIVIGIHTFFTSLNDLERIIRCPGRFKFEEHNVAAHSWKVSQFAMFFAMLEQTHGNTIDWKSLYEKTIYHDYAEIFIGDIKTPIKHADPLLHEMIKHVEQKMTKQFIMTHIPESFQNTFTHWLKEGKDETIEGQLLNLADKLDLLYEAFSEIRRGNTDDEFLMIYQTTLIKIIQIPLLNSVNYFLEQILPDLVKEANNPSLQHLTNNLIKSYVL